MTEHRPKLIFLFTDEFLNYFIDVTLNIISIDYSMTYTKQLWYDSKLGLNYPNTYFLLIQRDPS